MQLENESIILVDDERLHAAAVQALLEHEELEPEATGFTSSRRYRVSDYAVNVLLLPPENAHPFACLTLGQRAMVVNIKSVLCISAALSLRHDLHPGELTLVTQASALPYPALYASRPPEAQQDYAPQEPSNYLLSQDNLALGREMAKATLQRVAQRAISEVHTGYARHPTWGGGMMPWAREQFEMLAADGLEMISEIAVGVCDFAQRTPGVPVVCFNVTAGRVEEMAAGELARQGERDLENLSFLSGHSVREAANLVELFLGKC
jgi:hypothetical protein